MPIDAAALRAIKIYPGMKLGVSDFYDVMELGEKDFIPKLIKRIDTRIQSLDAKIKCLEDPAQAQGLMRWLEFENEWKDLCDSRKEITELLTMKRELEAM